jgi:hypothetical protein
MVGAVGQHWHAFALLFIILLLPFHISRWTDFYSINTGHTSRKFKEGRGVPLKVTDYFYNFVTK